MTFQQALEKLMDVNYMNYTVNITPLLMAMAEQVEANRAELERFREQYLEHTHRVPYDPKDDDLTGAPL